jgi:hypothetical protein
LYLRKTVPNCKWLFPSGKALFNTYMIGSSKHLTTRQLENLLSELDATIWPHLFRETRGATLVKQDEARFGEATLETVYLVKKSLNLERETTPWHYIDRYASEKIETEEEYI